MPTILIKNISEDLLKELKRLKVEFGCRSWAELLEFLMKFHPKETVSLSKEDVEKLERAWMNF